MVQWTIPEYLDQHPNMSPSEVITTFHPEAPAESNDKLSDWYKGGYNHLYDQIEEYQESVRNEETPDNTLKMSLLTWGTKDINQAKSNPSSETITPTDPNDPITQNANGSSSNQGGIRAYVTIGGDIVSTDVISITAEMASSYDEGNEQAKCTVTLHNASQKYGKKIAAYEWCPRITMIWAQAAIDYNKQDGSVETSTYMIFQGFMSDAKYNHETAEVSFGCISIEAAGSYDDSNWSPEDGYILKMQEVIKKIEDATDQEFPIMNLKQNSNQLIKQHFAPSDLSGNENLRSIAQDNKESFYFGHDFEDNVYVVLTDNDSYTDTVFLDPYVVEPGDTSNIFGHANDITVVGGSTELDETMRHVPTSVKDDVFAHVENLDSIHKYGRSPAYIKHELNLPKTQVDLAAEIEDENFKAYVDRDIKVVVANRIPKILSIVVFQVPDVASGELTWITAGVKKKQVEYSSSGIISHLECSRINTDYSREITNTGSITLETEVYTDANGTVWQYNYRNGNWHLATWGSDNLVWTYVNPDNAPSDVTDHFTNEISNIELLNDSVDSGWRSKN